MFVDSHCHIHADDFTADREEVLARAREMKVGYITDVCDDIKEMPEILHFCQTHDHIYTSVGVHPEYADRYPDLTVADLLKYTDNPYVIGIGECGLDYYYNADIKADQLRVLQIHIEAAQKSGLPLIIHNRASDEDMIKILTAAYKQKPFKGELHCFSSSAELCKAALDIGFYISASGIITFKKSEELRQIFKTVPDDRLLIETDSPYLAPTPHRGQRNEPAFVVNTAEVLAQVKEMPIEDLAALTTHNYLTLFDKVRQNDR
ncbi:MAG: TatD family hydrolase [Alphaproteobacteria bacterium]|nr:TatD family hydrolase [Alphaproteobacteria bacterium]